MLHERPRREKKSVNAATAVALTLTPKPQRFGSRETTRNAAALADNSSTGSVVRNADIAHHMEYCSAAPASGTCIQDQPTSTPNTP